MTKDENERLTKLEVNQVNILDELKRIKMESATKEEVGHLKEILSGLAGLPDKINKMNVDQQKFQSEIKASLKTWGLAFTGVIAIFRFV